MSDKLAFAPLQSLETALDVSVQQRARALFEAARSRTARGSGNDLDKSIAGNSTAIASACLLLAKTESEGPSNDDLDVHQRHAMITKPQFRQLINVLQSVLDLRSSAKTAYTPTRTSARKRKSVSQNDIEEPITPTKSAKSRTSTSASKTAASIGTLQTPTKQSARKSPRMSAASKALASGSHQKERAEMLVNEDEEASDSTRTRSSPRKVSEQAAKGASLKAAATRTPTKSNARVTATATVAFEKAMAQVTPTKATAVPKSASVKSQPAPVLRVELPQEEDKANAEESTPYETYWGDMMIRYRSKGDVNEQRKTTETWRRTMIKRVNTLL